MVTAKKNIVISAIILAVLIGGYFTYGMVFANSGKNANKMLGGKTPTGNLIGSVASSDDIYKMFLCPCCGQPLDKQKIC